MDPRRVLLSIKFQFYFLVAKQACFECLSREALPQDFFYNVGNNGFENIIITHSSSL